MGIEGAGLKLRKASEGEDPPRGQSGQAFLGPLTPEPQVMISMLPVLIHSWRGAIMLQQSQRRGDMLTWSLFFQASLRSKSPGPIDSAF